MTSAEINVLTLNEFITRIQNALAQGNKDDVLRLVSILMDSYPQNVDANFFAGRIYFEMDHYKEALGCLVHALNLKTVHMQAQEYFLYTLYFLKKYEVSPAISCHFISILNDPASLNPDLIERVWAQMLKNDASYGPVIEKAQSMDHAAFQSWWHDLPRGDIEKLTSSLLLGGMTIKMVPDVNVENYLVKLRAMLLSVAVSGTEVDKVFYEPLALAMGECCFNNEYLFNVSPEEQSALNDLVERAKNGKTDVFSIAVIASYAPLYAFPEIIKLTQKKFPKFAGKARLATLMRQQVLDIEAEREAASQIRTLAQIDDETSREVRQQYEENPYPRWRLLRGAHKDEMAHKIDGLVKGNVDILIAGCATGEYPINVALTYPKSRVTGIDLSLASLGYAKRKANEFKIRNLEFIQGDILDLAKLGKTFSVIESVGVIHHMREPEKGLEALLSVLEPGGHIKLGLYSALGRKHITQCQKAFVEQGFAADPQGMRDARRYVLSLEKDHPFRKMEGYSDFYSMSMLRDMLFHVEEHCFSIPAIKAMLERHDLEFLGFTDHGISEAPALYQGMFPDNPAMDNLDNWAKLEQEYPDSFVGMYKFWTHKII